MPAGLSWLNEASEKCTMRKPRSDSKLMRLSEEQQALLVEWLLSGIPYHEAKKLVEKEFGVRCSLSALSLFYGVCCQQHLIRRRDQAVNTANEVAEVAKKNPAQFDAATIDAIRQKAFELAISPMASAKDVKSLFMLISKNRDQELKAQQIELERRRVEMLERKLLAVQAAVTQAKTAGGLTPETLARIEEAAKLL